MTMEPHDRTPRDALDAALAALFDRIDAPAGFDARLVARLAREAEAERQFDRRTALARATQAYGAGAAAVRRRYRRSLALVAACGGAGLALVALTAPWWEQTVRGVTTLTAGLAASTAASPDRTMLLWGIAAASLVLPFSSRATRPDPRLG